MLNVSAITGRQGKARELARPAPPKREVLTAVRFPDDAYRREDDKERRVGIGDDELFVAHRSHLDAELFMQLSACGVRVGLPGLALAAGEFPESTVALVVRTLADEELVAA
jgi:hypothetical protein